MSADKEEFLKHKFVSLVKQIPTETPPAWGRMTLQQMIEHFTENVRIASGKIIRPEMVTPADHLQRLQQFVVSDNPFKENTKNPLLPEIPAPVQNKSVEDAVTELQEELDYFFSVFEANEHLLTQNPIFGDLNFQMNVHLLYKHAAHHLKQFGVEVAQTSATIDEGNY